jgi:hypothetical protein
MGGGTLSAYLIIDAQGEVRVHHGRPSLLDLFNAVVVIRIAADDFPSVVVEKNQMHMVDRTFSTTMKAVP